MEGGEANNSSPFLFIEIIDNFINAALDFGLSEADFWEMTFAEVNRFIESKQRTNKLHQKQQAINDYILADLIGRSIARIHSNSATMPSISEVYPTLFDAAAEAEEIQKKKDELSVIRFKQFAQNFNQKFKEVQVKSE